MNEAETCRTLVRPKLEESGWDGNRHFYSEEPHLEGLQIIGTFTTIESTPSRRMSDKPVHFNVNKYSMPSPQDIDHILKAFPIRDQIIQTATGTFQTMKNILIENVLHFLVPLHTESQHKEIIAHWDFLRHQTEQVGLVQERTSQELDAIFQSFFSNVLNGGASHV